MNLHEFQSKDLFKSYEIDVPKGIPVSNIKDAIKVYNELGSKKIVVKAQVHAGGRGKAGGVKIVDNLNDLEHEVKGMLGRHLVTHQTDSHGQPINQVLLELPSEIKKEYYLSILIDRATQKIKVVASSEGGMDIEAVADETPEKNNPNRC